MKKSVLILLAAASFAAAQCPTWVGRNETYAVGTIVEYNGSNYEAIREGGNGWTSPADTWFWSATSKTCTASSSSDASSSSSASNADLMAAISALSAKIDSVKAIAILAQGSSQASSVTGIFIDSRDGKAYPWVRLGANVWMAKNLDYETTDSWCYDNLPANCAKYGRLYTYAAAMNGAATPDDNAIGPQGICPEGWHLPSNLDWKGIGSMADATVLGSKLKVRGWQLPNVGTDEFGFSALPGGSIIANNFAGIGQGARWWTASLKGTSGIIRSVWSSSDMFYTVSYPIESSAFSVRCIMN